MISVTNEWRSKNVKILSLTVSVVVVEDGHAGLGVAVELGLLPVVRLLHPEAPGGAPVVEPE